jgi:hypothetical protein
MTKSKSKTSACRWPGLFSVMPSVVVATREGEMPAGPGGMGGEPTGAF